MKKLYISIMVMMTLAFAVSPVFAAGGIRLDPHGSYYPEAVMLTSPATFNVYLENHQALDPHIFLVMTESCFKGLTGPVTVSWQGGSIQITTWTKETVNSVKVPPGCESGTGYTVSCLQDHLSTTEAIYWAFVPFLAGPITATKSEFTVTMSSANQIMMVYALGKAPGETLFSNRVPPTQPGFVVPEIAPILLALASASALGLYAFKRRRTTTIIPV